MVKNVRGTEISEEMQDVLLQLEIDKYHDLYELDPANYPKYTHISEFSEEEQLKLCTWLHEFHEELFSHEKFIIQNHEGNIVGIAEYRIDKVAEHHQLHPKIIILRKFQRQGFGRSTWQQLLKQLPSHLEVEIRTSATIERGKRFIESLGFEPLVEQVSSFLYLKNARWELYQQWIEDVDQDEFTVVIFRECPEDIIEEYCEVYNKIKSYSGSRMIYGPYCINPERRREYENQFGMNAGYDWSTIIIQDRDGKIIGLTETYVDLNEEGKMAYQELTGILPDYRGKGLAKWIKGLMMLRLRDLYPQLEKIRVSNWRGVENLNTTIFALNTKMGYTELFSTQHYHMRS